VPDVRAVDGEAVRLRQRAAGLAEVLRDRDLGVVEPAAAVTPCSLATLATDDALIGAYCEPRLSTFCPAALWQWPLLQICAPFGLIWNVCEFLGGLLPVLGGPGAAPVTVTSVPTPYSPCSTADWAFFTPFEVAITVTTRPTPTARPSAMKMACRIRRRSSRRR